MLNQPQIFAEISHKTWDMEKKPEPEDARSETSDAGLIAFIF